MSPPITPLVVCGGSGARLWPLSRRNRPKQFLPILGPRSAFQETLLRVSDRDLFDRPVVVANRDHRFLVADQVQEIGLEADILLEPEARDSGPALAAGARFVAARKGGEAAILSLAADHVIRDAQGFRAACREALAGARAGYIVTFGIVPTHASTDYGYIEAGEVLNGRIARVRRFVEKPDRETAETYRQRGMLWNSGNLLFEARTLLEEYAAQEPETAAAIEHAAQNAVMKDVFLHLDPAGFARAKKRSIDHAVMEKTAKAAVLPASFDWVDIGSWNAIGNLLPQDEQGNAASGPSTFLEARCNVIYSEGPTVAVVGLDDLAVVATPDAILVARRGDVVGVKRLVEQLRTAHDDLT